MGILNTLAGWAKSAWGAIFGAASDLTGALTKFWSYVNSLHGLLGWIVGFPVLQVLRALLSHSQASSDSLAALLAALARLRHWIWVHEVVPVYNRLNTAIGNLFAWTRRQLWATWLHFELRYRQALAYAARLTALERQQRIAAVANEHALMMKRVAWALQMVQQEAASGYNSVTTARKNLIVSLLSDVAERDPAVKGLVKDLVALVIDIDTIDNPVARYAISHLLSAVISHLGIDQAVTGLIRRLLEPLTGDPKPGSLYAVERDVASRLNALEAQWAQFMDDGGPELEQAGKGWKDLTGLAVDAAVLGFTGLAVTDPAGWATAVNDTIGAVAAETMTGIVDLINRA